ncbi:MAG TPA: HAD-IA family hydrolase [Solirubrobacteraceae bacterium]|nr:HAD-IA family hydrolase [Solirubrobacteraceae bacterium]
MSVGDVDAVLLDGLGTLLALQPPAPALVRLLRERHGVELAAADAERAFGAEIAYYRAHHREGRDPATLADLRRRCAETLRAQLPATAARRLSLAQLTETMLEALRFVAYPDAHPALARLRARGQALVVVSNWDASLPTVLHEAGLGELVDGVVTSAEVGHAKPARAIFDAALGLAGSSPARTVHVGDSIEHDVCGALAAGIKPVLLRRDGAAVGAGAGVDEAAARGVTPISAPGDAATVSCPRHVLTISSLAQLLA